MTDDHDRNAPPLNRLPGAVWLLLAGLLGVELVLSLAGQGLIGGAQGVGWRIRAIENGAYTSAIQHWMLETWRFPPQHLARYLTYSFIHASPMHALFGAVLVAALGKMLADRMGTAAILTLALGGPVLAAVLFGLVMGQDRLGWLVGAMPMAFGLVGAFTWLRWSDAAGDRDKQRRAFGLIAVLLGARLAFGLIAESGPFWIAEVAAFALGFGATALFLGPGRWARLRARLKG